MINAFKTYYIVFKIDFSIVLFYFIFTNVHWVCFDRLTKLVEVRVYKFENIFNKVLEL